ncbi:MAG: glycine cleavage system protein GcvH [Anaerolineaceae bacterium]|jgi:glycine cleavage system H protein
MNIPSDLKYTKADEWLRIEGNTATLGVTDYAQDQLSDVVFVEIAAAQGDEVKKGDIAATLESVKAAADVNFPVSGTITDINEDLSLNPEIVNSDPYGDAWMVKLSLADQKEVADLMDAAAYETYCQERSH